MSKTDEAVTVSQAIEAAQPFLRDEYARLNHYRIAKIAWDGERQQKRKLELEKVREIARLSASGVNNHRIGLTVGASNLTVQKWQGKLELAYCEDAERQLAEIYEMGYCELCDAVVESQAQAMFHLLQKCLED